MRSSPAPAPAGPDLNGPEPALGRRERNKAEKRARILSAATKLFNEQGFEATTTSAIAKAAGIGTGTLFLYVRSKEDLLVAVFREEVGRAWDEAFAAVDPEAPLAEQLRVAFHSVIRYHERDPWLSRAFLKELLFVAPPVREGVTDFMRGFMGRLRNLLVDAQARGELAADVPTGVLASNLWALFYTLVQRRHTGGMSPERLLVQIDEAFALLLRGLEP